jgi:hypothetical protein
MVDLIITFFETTEHRDTERFRQDGGLISNSACWWLFSHVMGNFGIHHPSALDGLGSNIILFHLLPTLFTQYFNWIGLVSSVLLLYSILSELWFALLGFVSHLVTALRCKRFIFSLTILLGLLGFLTPYLLSPGPGIHGRFYLEVPVTDDEGIASEILQLL